MHSTEIVYAPTRCAVLRCSMLLRAFRRPQYPSTDLNVHTPLAQPWPDTEEDLVQADPVQVQGQGQPRTRYEEPVQRPKYRTRNRIFRAICTRNVVSCIGFWGCTSTQVLTRRPSSPTTSEPVPVEGYLEFRNSFNARANDNRNGNSNGLANFSGNSNGNSNGFNGNGAEPAPKPEAFQLQITQVRARSNEKSSIPRTSCTETGDKCILFRRSLPVGGVRSSTSMILYCHQYHDH
eukprot:3315362-Rhodomonas_salina.4